MKMNILSIILGFICIILVTFFDSTSCSFRTIPIGLISEPGDITSMTILRNALWTGKNKQWTFRNFTFEVERVLVNSDDTIALQRAVCNLMKKGIQALVAPSNPKSHRVLSSFAQQYELPLLSPAIPESDSLTTYQISVQPSTTRALVHLFRSYSMRHLVYLYDSDEGPQRLQRIFTISHRVFDISLSGISRVEKAEEAVTFFRKLQDMRNQRYFPVVLDMNPTLAKEIVIRHVHDPSIVKANYHFLLAQPVLDGFWMTNSAEFGEVNVTGFEVIDPDTARDFRALDVTNFEMSTYLYHDAGLVLAEGMRLLVNDRRSPWRRDKPSLSRNCLDENNNPIPGGRMLADFMKQSNISHGLTGHIEFEPYGSRRNFELKVMRGRRFGRYEVGTFSPEKGFNEKKLVSQFGSSQNPVALASIKAAMHSVTTVISPPFMMYRELSDNGTKLAGNDRFEGYCKDLLDIIANEMTFDYTLKIVEDGEYGSFDKTKGRWSGTIGEIMEGGADMVVADLHLTASRQKAVDFMEPYTTVSLSILLKNPLSTSTAYTSFFVTSAFSGAVWICLLVSTVAVAMLFHVLTEFTGTPDNIEDASGIWGKKFSVFSSLWFTVGSALMLDTGVYPRSLSSRLLGGAWWCFCSALLAFYVAGLTSQLAVVSSDQPTPQLAKLSALSFESVMMESVVNDWPRLGIYKGANTYRYVKASTIPVFSSYANYIQRRPELVMNSTEEAVSMVLESQGSFAFLTESLYSEYYSKHHPCDTISIHDEVASTAYAIAIPKNYEKNNLNKKALNKALETIRRRGELVNIHRKWFMQSIPCKIDSFVRGDDPNGKLHTLSGLFFILLSGIAISFLVGGAQYFWNRKHDNGRRRLSFEDVVMGQNFPLPPPEPIADPPAEGSDIVYGWAGRKLIPSSFGHRSQQQNAE